MDPPGERSIGGREVMDYYRIRRGLLLSMVILAAVALVMWGMVATSHAVDAQLTAQFAAFLAAGG